MHRQKIDKDLIFAQIGQFSPNHVTLEPTYGKHKYLLSPSNLKLDQMSNGSRSLTYYYYILLPLNSKFELNKFKSFF